MPEAPTASAGAVTPLRVRAVCALVLVLGLVGAGACGDPDDVPAPAPHPDPTIANGERAAPPPGPKIDEKWFAARPRFTLVFVGAQLGKHKPCGCSEPQLGGVERLAALLDALRKRALNGVAPLALGWTLAGNMEPQEEYKAAFIRQVYEDLGFSGLLLGTTDLRVPAMCQSQGMQGIQSPRPPIDVRLSPSVLASDKQPLFDFQVDGVDFRAFSLIGPEDGEALKAEGLALDSITTSAVFQFLKPRKELIWIASTRIVDEAQVKLVRTSMQRLGPSIIVNMTDGLGETSLDGIELRPDMNPLLLNMQDKGKSVGVLDFFKDPGETRWSVSYRSVALTPALEAWESKSRAQVKEVLGWYVSDVRTDRVLDLFTSRPDEGARYVGSHACRACHEQIYNDWNETPHGHAMGTLRDNGPGYHWDPECVRCHVVGWMRFPNDRWARWDSGFANVETTPLLTNVGCENCHGPGSAHVANPYADRLFRPAGEGALEAWRRRCTDCHDPDNSVRFNQDYERYYYPRVDHRSVPTDKRTVVPKTWKPKKPDKGPK